jgi:hypothetical protein
MMLGRMDHVLQEADRALRPVTCSCERGGEHHVRFDLVPHGPARRGAFDGSLGGCHRIGGPALGEQDLGGDPVVPDRVPPAGQAGGAVEQDVGLTREPEAQRVGGKTEQDVRADLVVIGE